MLSLLYAVESRPMSAGPGYHPSQTVMLENYLMQCNLSKVFIIQFLCGLVNDIH